jgi:tetratricopeptide (TPR) repeat protein
MSDAPVTTQPRQSRQIFISYSRADRLAVDRLCGDLTRHDHQVWVDSAEHGIETGENWRDELKRQVSRSDAMIACLSPDYFRSEFCKAELAQAVAEKKPIFPVKVRRLTPEEETAGMTALGIADLQYTDLSSTIEAYGEGVRRLRRRLPPPPLVSGQRMLRLARALMVVTAFLGVFILGGVAAVAAIEASAPPPSVAGHTIGVVVADFDLPEDGSVDRADGDVVVQRFSNLLRQELDGAVKPLRLTYGFLGPDITDPVTGDLRDYAAQYGADVVIYGQIDRDDAGELIVQPRFYLNPDTFTDALEMVGASGFGAPVRLVNTSGGTVEQALSARSLTLTQVVIGLSRYLLGDYTGAQTAFERAAETAQLDGQRIEAVLAMVGSARLKVASESMTRGDAEAAAPLLAGAEQAYREALDASPDYARAYTGLAAAQYLAWNAARQRGEAPQVDLLNSALTALEQADAAVQQPNLIYQTRALLPRMQIQYARWVNYPTTINPDEYDALPQDIIDTAARILAFYENGTQPAVEDVAAEAYKFLGLVAYGLSDCPTAIDAYNKGIEIATPLNRTYMTGWIGDCHAETGDDEAALESYEQALSLGEAAGAPAAILDHYRTQIESFSGRG